MPIFKDEFYLPEHTFFNVTDSISYAVNAGAIVIWYGKSKRTRVQLLGKQSEREREREREKKNKAELEFTVAGSWPLSDLGQGTSVSADHGWMTVSVEDC